MDWTQLIGIAVEIANNATTKYGPIAWEATLWLVRIDSMQWVGLGLIFLITSIISLIFNVKLFKWSIKKEAEGYIAISLFSFLGIFILFAMAMNHLLNIWNWIGLFWPELLLAKQVLDKVT